MIMINNNNSNADDNKSNNNNSNNNSTNDNNNNVTIKKSDSEKCLCEELFPSTLSRLMCLDHRLQIGRAHV